MRRRGWLGLVAFLLCLAPTVACPGRHAWMADESERIDQIIRREPFCEHTRGAEGIAVVNAPPIAAPPAPSETYSFRSGRDRRVSGSRTTTTPRARAKSKRQGTAGSVTLAGELDP